MLMLLLVLVIDAVGSDRYSNVEIRMTKQI